MLPLIAGPVLLVQLWPVIAGVVVDNSFQDYVKEKFRPSQATIRSGWMMELPSGKKASRTRLQEQAAPIIALGPEAVPHLFKWLKHENLAIRYIATHALEKLTGITPLFYFDPDPTGAARERAIGLWKAWYERRRGK